MPRYSIQNPETKQWRCFSTIVDDFICDWMDRDDYIEWKLKEERERITKELSSLEKYPYMTYEECLKTIEWREYCEQMDPDDDGSTVIEDYKRIFNGGRRNES